MTSTRKLILTVAAVLLMTLSSYGVATAQTHTAVVVEVVDGGGYTYLNVEENGERFWLAGPQTAVSEGARVSFSEQLWMPGFHSKALGRTFDKLLFVNGIQVVSNGAGAATSAPAATGAELKPVGSFTVEELITKRYELKGQVVELTGEVVKVSENIMGRTWVHISDGTGAEGTRKMVFRSVNDTATVGSNVTATGTLAVDQDFGFGYFYPFIVEDAVFTETEQPSLP